MQESVRPRNQLIPALGAIVLLIGGAWIASQGGLTAAGNFTSEASSKFFGAWFQLVSSLPVLICLWIGAIGLGAPFRLWLVPNAKHWLIVQAGCGWGVLLMLDWLAAWFGLLNSWTAWGFCGLGLAVWTYYFADPQQRQRWHPDNWPSPPWTLLLGLPAVGLLLIVCACPPSTLWAVEAFGYDVTSYHLQVVREWMQQGGMVSLEHNVYSHLPLFNEAGYMQIGVMADSVYAGIYTTQFLHASMALFAAVAVAKLVSSFTSRAAGVFGGVMLLVLPWTIITGSLAYNEMFVLAFGATALLVLFDEHTDTRGGAGMLGLLIGFAVLSKLTSLGMIAVPIGVVLLTRVRSGTSEPAGEKPASTNESPNEERTPQVKGAQRPLRPLPYLGLAVLVAVLTISPFLVRNTLWTGNPVFPFATGVFGLGHWEQDNADRWQQGHASKGVGAGLTDLPRQWLLNRGYGAVFGRQSTGRQATDMARFDAEYGVPLFWVMAFVGIALGVREKKPRRLMIGMLIMLGCQLLFWLLATHHQSRFLVPTLLPGCVGAGLLFHRTSQWFDQRGKPIVHDLLASAAVLLMTMSLFSTAWSQARQVIDPSTSQPFPLWFWTDTLIDPADLTVNQPGRRAGDHPLNDRVKTSAALDKVSKPNRVLMVPGTGPLLYIRRPVVYNTPFDRSLLSELIARHGADPGAVSLALHQRGITHVWVNASELSRLVKSYGIDKELTPGNLRALTKAWVRADDGQVSTTLLFDIRPAVAAVMRRDNEEDEMTNTDQTNPQAD